MSIDWPAWGTWPALYLSYGMASLKGRRPALTNVVAAAPSFTALSPPILRRVRRRPAGLGAAVAQRLRARLAAVTTRIMHIDTGAVAERIDGELRSEAPRFGGASRDVAGWWRTVIREAFRAVHGEVVANGGAGGGGGEGVLDGATAVVALVLEKYIVVANCGGSKAVLSRGGVHVELTPDNSSSSRQAHKRAVEKEKMTMPEPEVVAVERNARDDFLILASDGLWGAVSPPAACALVRRRLVKTPRIARPGQPPPLDGRGSPTVLAKEVAEHAVHAGSQDNVSVVLVMFRDFWGARSRTASQGNKYSVAYC